MILGREWPIQKRPLEIHKEFSSSRFLSLSVGMYIVGHGQRNFVWVLGIDLSRCMMSPGDRILMEVGWTKRWECCWINKSYPATILVIFVDNFFVFSPKREGEEVFESLRQKLRLVLEGQTENEDGSITWDILGIAATYRPGKEMLLSQKQYSEKLVSKLGGKEGKCPKIPCVEAESAEFTSQVSVISPDNISQKTKMELSGSLNYLACATRPDLTVGLKYLAGLTDVEKSIQGLRRMIKYLRNPRAMIYRPNDSFFSEGEDGTKYLDIVLGIWCDSDWASFPDRRSISGILINLNGSPVQWRSITQRSIATSASESEVYACSEGCKTGCVIQQFLLRILEQLQNAIPSHTVRIVVPSPVFEDNVGALKYASNPLVTKNLKHIEIRDAMCRDYVARGYVKLVQVPTQLQKANGLTKLLKTFPEHEHFLNQVNLIDIP